MRNNINEKKIKNNKTKFRKEHIAPKKTDAMIILVKRSSSTKYNDKEKKRKENKKKSQQTNKHNVS